MNKSKFLCLFPFIFFILTGCHLQVPLEDQGVTLIFGIDLNENNQLTFYTASPVFAESAKNKIEINQAQGVTLRDSRKDLDAHSFGEITGTKIQVVLIGKKVLEHEDWFPVVDHLYRAFSMPTQTVVVIVDGPVSDVMYEQPKDKPLLPIFIEDLILHTNDRGRTVQTSIRELHRQMFEKGLTPSISLLKKDKEIFVYGTILLNEKGKVVGNLDNYDTTFLLALQDELTGEVTFSGISYPKIKNGGIFHKNKFSITSENRKTSIKSKYNEDHFEFDIKLKIPFTIVEQLFTIDFSTTKSQKEFENIVNQQLEKKFMTVIKKFQKKKIDPIGLGLYARAFHYKEYKKVENNWGEAFSKSKITITVDSEIFGRGTLK